MTENPYAAPVAVLEEARPAGVIRLYSPGQIGGGAFLGGPVGATYFLWSNFRALGNAAAARTTLWAGAVGSIALLAAHTFLPDLPSLPFNVAYLFLSIWVASRWQRTNAQIETSPDLAFHSNWRVVGLALAWLFATLVVTVTVVFGLEFAGLLPE